jgi:hypothetical protein
MMYSYYVDLKPDHLPTKQQLRDTGFTRRERVGLFVQDVLFGQFRDQWPSTVAVIRRIGNSSTMDTPADENQYVNPAESIITGL